MSDKVITRLQKFLRVLVDESAYMPEPLKILEHACCYACGHLDSMPHPPVTRREKLIASVRDKSIVPPTPVTRLEKYIAAIAGYYTDDLPEPVTREDKILYDLACGEDVTLSGNPLVLENSIGKPLKECVISWEPTQAGSGEPYPAGGGPNLLDISKCTAGFTPYGLATAISGDLLTIKGTASITSDSASFVVAMTPDTSLSGKGYKVTAFAAKGSITNAYGLRTADEQAIAVLMPLTEGAAVDVALRIMVSKDTPTAYAPYENIRPISGRDNVKMQRSGENLLDMSRVAENKGCTVEGSAIHLVDTSGWGSSYILFAPIYPAGTYTIQVDADAAKHGRFLLRGYDANGNMVDVSILPRMIGYETSYNVYYKSTLLYLYNSSGTHKVITFTVQGAAYFQVGLTGGISAGETSADFKNFALVPGSTPPTTYTPYRGDTLALALPSTIYGGTVDAVTGEGAETAKVITLDGASQRFVEASRGDYWNMEFYSAPGIYAIIATSHFAKTRFDVNQKYDFVFTTPHGMQDLFASAAELNAYLAAQYAAGTPVQIAYKLAEPVPFQATGNGLLLPIPGETNTVMTDADSVTVTGRADPIRIIQQLQAAQNTAAVQLAETQQAVVDTTAMAVDYIYEQDSQIFGGDDNDSETDTVLA